MTIVACRSEQNTRGPMSVRPLEMGIPHSKIVAWPQIKGIRMSKLNQSWDKL